MRKLKLEELGRLSVEEFKESDKVSLIVVCDNIRSALNVGSIFRTADAMGIEKVVLCGITSTPPSNEINKTAIGADESMDWEYFEEVSVALKQLKTDGYQIYAIEQTNSSVEILDISISNEQKIAIIMGNEVHGVSDEALPLIDQAIELRQYGTKHSLNVAVCAGIVIHHFAEKLRGSF